MYRNRFNTVLVDTNYKKGIPICSYFQCNPKSAENILVLFKPVSEAKLFTTFLHIFSFQFLLLALKLDDRQKHLTQPVRIQEVKVIQPVSVIVNVNEASTFLKKVNGCKR